MMPHYFRLCYILNSWHCRGFNRVVTGNILLCCSVTTEPWYTTAVLFLVILYLSVLSTDNEFIPTRNASLAAMHGSASGCNVHCPTWNIRPSSKEMNKAVTMLKLPMFAVRLRTITSLYRWPIGSLPSTCMLLTPSRIALRALTPRRDQLMIYGQYVESPIVFIAWN
jgi:hypothetical protein